jgi:hypothetical protein
MTPDSKVLLSFKQSLGEVARRIREERPLQVENGEVSDALTLRIGFGDERFHFTTDRIHEAVRDFDFSGFEPAVKPLTNVERARSYLLGELGGGTTLARLALERVNSHEGRFFMIVPKRIDPDQLQNQLHGLIGPDTDPTRYSEFRDEVFRVHFKAARVLASTVRAFTIALGYHLLGQDTLMTLDDMESYHPEQLSSWGKEWVSYENEIYSFTRGDSSERDIETAIDNATLWPRGVFLCRGVVLLGASKLL